MRAIWLELSAPLLLAPRGRNGSGLAAARRKATMLSKRKHGTLTWLPMCNAMTIDEQILPIIVITI